MTKEQIEQLYNDPFARMLANIYGFPVFKDGKEHADITPKINNPIKEEPNNSKDSFAELVHNFVDKLEKEGKLKKEVVNTPSGTATYYHSVDEADNKPTVEESVKSEEKPSFVMNQFEFEKFIKDYRTLVDNLAKLRYTYGIELNSAGSSFSFEAKATQIIWNLVQIIFGEDNLDDIADFIYGNSNFDSAKDLYDELT